MSASTLTLDSQLESLEMAQLVRRADDPDLAYLFKHTLTQETAYQSLLQKRRRKVHRLVAEAYETAYSDRLPQIAAILSQHYAQSGDDAKTLTYAVMAGDEAARVYAHAEAISHYSLALSVAKKGDAQNAASIQELYIKRGRAMEVSNQYAEALANYQEMEAQGRAQSDPTLILTALIAMATLYSLPTSLSDTAKVQELSDRALALARESADRQAESKILWNLMLSNYFSNKPHESLKYGEQSLAIAREFNLGEQLAFTLNDISRAYSAVGQSERALDTQTEARGLWRELGNLPLLADSLTNSAAVYLNLGKLEDGRILLEEALGIVRSIGNSWGETYAEQVLSFLYYETGRLGDAFAMLESSIRLGEQIGAVFATSVGYPLLSWAYARLGAPVRALECAQKGVAITERSLPSYLPIARAMLGYAYFVNGDLAKAEVYVEKSHENLDPRNFDFPTPFFVTVVGAEVALSKGEFRPAIQMLDSLIGTMRELGIRAFMAEALYFKARALAASGQVQAARAILMEARASAETVGERTSLFSILCELSRIEMTRANGGEAEALRSQACEIATSISQGLPTDLARSFLNLPDARFAMGLE